MLPGRVYKPEDVLLILRRRVWWVLVPFAMVSAATAIYVRGLPNRYRSETLVLVIPQRVPEQYVRSTVSSDIQDRLRSIQPTILSRTRLEQIIQEFNLYAEERASGALMEDVVLRMRTSDVSVATVRDDAFRVAYTGSNPVTVQKVTDRLAQLFINENLEDRTNIAEGTNEFLEQQLADAKQQLLQTEQRLEAYKREHSGELPTQIASNLAQVQGARSQMATVSESLERDLDRKMTLEAHVAELRAATGTLPQTPTGALRVVPSSAAQELARARESAKALELRGYKPGHPDLESARRKVRDLEAKLERDVQNPSAASSGETSPLEVERQRRITEIQVQLQALAVQMVNKQEDLVQLQKKVDEYQARVDATPTRESELTELTRDYATFQGQYTNLLVKKNEWRIAANLEQRQIGEQFSVIDPAKAAQRPQSPNRTRLNLVGMVAGLAVGLLLTAGLEYRDTTLKTDDDVTSVLGLPVVAVVPTMQSDLDRRRAIRQRAVVNVGLGSTVAGCAVVLAYAFLR